MGKGCKSLQETGDRKVNGEYDASHRQMQLKSIAKSERS